MNAPAGLEHCLNFINCHLQPPVGPVSYQQPSEQKQAITLSRQSGCGAHAVAEKLAAYLQSRNPQAVPPWTIFDRNLVEKVLQDHHLPERLARFMKEDRVGEINDIMDELFGLHPSSWVMLHQVAETVLRLAEAGNAILVGRGANVITAKLPHVLHVRLVASLEHRVEQRQRFENISRKKALNSIVREDRGRERYLRKHFGRDIDDPLLYHLVINTDLVSVDDAASMIGDLAMKRVMSA